MMCNLIILINNVVFIKILIYYNLIHFNHFLYINSLCKQYILSTHSYILNLAFHLHHVHLNQDLKHQAQEIQPMGIFHLINSKME